MIDMDLFGIKRVGAAYLIQAGKTCLIDSGTKKEARNIIKALDSISVFPDILILTHSHFDHSQGAPTFLREAKKRGVNLTVMASEKAISNLKDQSWNKVFGNNKYENISDVQPLKDREIIDLGGIELEIFDFSGHCEDDIGIYDKKNKTIFIGDSLGYKVQDLLVPPFMPPFWDKNGFNNTISTLKEIEYEKLCLAHFGCLEGESAKNYPDEIDKTLTLWWETLTSLESKGKINDLPYVIEAIISEMDLALPELEVSSTWAKYALWAVNLVNRIIGRKQIHVADLQIEVITGWLVEGFKVSKGLN
jgi:glyoxylase-like metal-dependent hydrolase (beta-lactamase superfamily II)